MASSMGNKTVVRPKVCISKEKTMNYRGIFVSGNPLDYIIPLFMFQLILFVVISRVIYIILRPLKQPKIVCNILAGIILGPSVLGRYKSYMAAMFPPKENIVLASTANLGILLFVFLVCIKIDVSMVSRTVNKTWRVAAACMILPFLFTQTLMSLLRNFLPGVGDGASFPFQFSLTSSLSFFIVIVNALDELNLLSSELGQLSTSIAMINEVVQYFLVIVGVVFGQKNTLHMLYAFLGVAGWMSLAIYVVKPILHWIIKRTPKGEPVKECYVTAIILSTLLMGMITEALGVSFWPAAMVMGLIIPAGPPLGSTIIEKCELLMSEFFMPLFFVRLGYFTNLSTIQDLSEFVAFASVILVGYLGRLVGSCMVASSINMRNSSAILLSLILSLEGIIELLIGLRWKYLKALSDQNFATLVLSIVVLNAIVTPIIEIFYKAEMKSFETAVKLHSRSIGMTSQLGELHIISCVQHEDNVPSIINLFEALNPREMSPICAYVIHLVPLATQTVPLLAPYNNHRKMFSNPNDSDNIMRAFINYTKNSMRPVQLLPFRMVSPSKYMHEPICRLAEEIRTPLIIVPFFNTQGLSHGSTDGGSLRIFNTNIQSTATCTVGILVDRGLRTVMISSDNVSYNVAVIFVGGADGREALAFAARMSRHPNISITVLRINVVGDGARGFEREREIDDCFFRDFMAMAIGNACVVCHELVVENMADLICAMHALANGYDIVVAGKRQGCNSVFEKDLIDWAEFPELGVLGDVIAAPEFCGGMMSVLVLQHYSEENRSTSRLGYFAS